MELPDGHDPAVHVAEVELDVVVGLVVLGFAVSEAVEVGEVAGRLPWLDVDVGVVDARDHGIFNVVFHVHNVSEEQKNIFSFSNFLNLNRSNDSVNGAGI